MKYIVDFIDTATQEQINTYLVHANLTSVKQFGSFGNVFLVDGTNTPPKTDLVEAVSEDAEAPLQLMEVNDLAQIEVPINDENWWKVVSLNQSFNTDKTSYSHYVNKAVYDVYLIDSGINVSHPEFAGQSITNLYSVTGEYGDTRGHGTALASVITGNTCAISRANIVNVKIIDQTSTLTTAQIVEALDTIKLHSDSRPSVPAVANMSWSIPKNDYINAKIELLIASGVTVSASAGNSGIAIADVTPACIPTVFTIGAYNKNFEPCDFSNYTSPLATTPNGVNYGAIDMWAPGQDVRVANKDGGYYITAGTSIAAAIYTAAISYNLSELETNYNAYFNEPFNKSAAQGTMLYAKAAKWDILTLTGNYVNSANKIITFSLHGSTILTQMWREGNGDFFPSKAFKFWKGTNSFSFLFPLDKVRSWEVIGTLPSGVELVRGWFIAKVSELPGPVIESHIAIKITENDGTVRIQDLTIMVVDDELLAALPDTDPQKIWLALPGDGCHASCIQDCSPGIPCSDNGTGKACGCYA